ncbi:MAG: hypothetical protein IPK16_30680 [Anaerolineales bacterium]|nr:hypothetical protein [Anaerolineales bacterium]
MKEWNGTPNASHCAMRRDRIGGFFFLVWLLNLGLSVPFGDDIPSFGALTLLFGIFVALVSLHFAHAHGSRPQGLQATTAPQSIGTGRWRPW